VYIVTVNKVQKDYDSVPVYATYGGDLTQLNRFTTSQSHKFNLRKYLNSHSISAHVGDLHFTDAETEVGTYPTHSDTSPIVSVLLPFHNARFTLGSCLESLLLQTFNNFEIICIDDGSSDGGSEIVEEYATKALSTRKDITFMLMKPGRVSLPRALDLGMYVLIPFLLKPYTVI
jgi:hypothetical protein